MHEGTPVWNTVDLFPRWCKGCFDTGGEFFGADTFRHERSVMIAHLDGCRMV